MRKKTIHYLLLGGKWTITLSLIVVMFVGLKEEYRKAKMKKLNFFMPTSYAHLIETEDLTTDLARAQLAPYDYYYRLLADLFPERDDVYALLGFCRYYLGQDQAARQFYQKAVELNPYFFWSHFNLGVIHFKKGEFAAAESSLIKSLSINPDVTVRVIGHSKVYADILGSLPNIDHTFHLRLKEGYREAHLMLVLSYYYQNKFPAMRTQSLTAIRAGLDQQGEFSYLAGMAALALKDYEQAGSFLQNALAQNGPFQDILAQYGWKEEAFRNASQRSAVISQMDWPRKSRGPLIFLAKKAHVKVF